MEGESAKRTIHTIVKCLIDYDLTEEDSIGDLLTELRGVVKYDKPESTTGWSTGLDVPNAGSSSISYRKS